MMMYRLLVSSNYYLTPYLILKVQEQPAEEEGQVLEEVWALQAVVEE